MSLNDTCLSLILSVATVTTNIYFLLICQAVISSLHVLSGLSSQLPHVVTHTFFFNYGKIYVNIYHLNFLTVQYIHWIYNLCILTLLWNISRTFSSCKTNSPCLLKNTPFLPPTAPGPYYFKHPFCFYEFDYFRSLISVESRTICLLVTDLFHLA